MLLRRSVLDLESQGDLVRRLIALVNHVASPIIPMTLQVGVCLEIPQPTTRVALARVTLRAHVPNSWVLGILVLVLLGQVLRKYMIQDP